MIPSIQVKIFTVCALPSESASQISMRFLKDSVLEMRRAFRSGVVKLTYCYLSDLASARRENRFGFSSAPFFRCSSDCRITLCYCSRGFLAQSFRVCP